MKLKGIKISREAKILFGLMCLAAAILIWVNLASQRFPLFGGQQDVTVAPSTPAATPAADAVSSADAVTATPDASVLTATPEGAAPATDPAVIEAPTLDGGTQTAPDAGTTSDAVTADGAAAPVAGSMVDISAVSPDGSVAVTTPDAVTPTVEATTPEVAPSVAAAPIAARDVQLAELPFLVTEAPVAPVEEATAETATEETTRPGEQRASINPFSPIVLAPVETIAEAQPVPDAGLQPIEVPTNPEPITVVGEELAGSVNEIQTEPLVAEGPLPEAVLPAPAVASLPRPLPMASTPVAPEILRNMSRTPASGTAEAPVNEVIFPAAAIREPVQATPATPAIIGASVVGSVDSSEVELEPVGSMASASTSTDAGSAATGAPIYVGASPLSTYLRDNDVRFTMLASGPVAVAVFSSKLSQNPVVVPLGQTLPDTEFVLTNLQGKEAEFSYGQEKQKLTLDLRR